MLCCVPPAQDLQSSKNFGRLPAIRASSHIKSYSSDPKQLSLAAQSLANGRTSSQALRQDSVNDSLNLRVRSNEELDREVRALGS